MRSEARALLCPTKTDDSLRIRQKITRKMTPTIQPTAASARERSNWDVLSLVRFLLALFVAVYHLSFFTDVGPARMLIKLGPFEAVMSFLLISGYSIGHSIAKKPEG